MKTEITAPPRFCVNCDHSFKLLEYGEYYCRLSAQKVNPVTGNCTRSFCEIERADADRCGPEAKNFAPKKEELPRNNPNPRSHV